MFFSRMCSDTKEPNSWNYILCLCLASHKYGNFSEPYYFILLFYRFAMQIAIGNETHDCIKPVYVINNEYLRQTGHQPTYY